uniref:response regulator n=1 Tax=Thaumasiovibrio occultus TaxID=1891184 RepID=UPI000B361F06|nr:response regulator [Thaumasiovibrio occultus]
MKILICDDSLIVRKRLAAYLPEEFDKAQAANGAEALDMLREQAFDLLFLDLTMPVMDGYQLLDALNREHRMLPVVVISADIQPKAKAWCQEAGVLDFIEKPFQPDQVSALLQAHFGAKLITPAKEALHADTLPQLQELSNVALGKGASIISQQLGDFIRMPMPNVGLIDASALHMIQQDLRRNADMLSVSQRFVGGGIHGEAIVSLSGNDIDAYVQKLSLEHGAASAQEQVLDLANLLVSSFLHSLGEQVLIDFSIRPPMVIEPEFSAAFDDGASALKGNDYLSIEYSYSSNDEDFYCDVLFLMSERASLHWEKILRIA